MGAKKVNSTRQIKIKRVDQYSRNSNPLPASVIRPKNQMLNTENLEGKSGGVDLDSYNLDLMKLE